MKKLNFKRDTFKRNNREALKMLILPTILFLVLFNTLHSSLPFYILGQICGAIFFAQCFIMMHEFGHRSFFNSVKLNTFFGHIASFFTFIPYYNWLEIHDLHHKWTGYRDKDPTTEKTFDDRLTPFQRGLVNFCWKYYIPLFTIGYRFGIYWKAEKLKRHLPHAHYIRCLYSMAIYAALYLAIIIYAPKTILLVLPAILVSFSITDIISMSQHSHIRMLNSEGKDVAPLAYKDQIKFSRSLILPSWASKYLMFNMNFHESHHAYPGMPCYHLPKVNIENVNSYPFIPWLIKVKSMEGVNFVFKSDPNRKGF